MPATKTNIAAKNGQCLFILLHYSRFYYAYPDIIMVSMRDMLQYIVLMRPFGWVKNIFVFAPIFFAGAIFDYPSLLLAASAFVVFSLVSSSVYVLNDIADLEHDRNHSAKKARPIASGRISVLNAKLFFGVLFLVAFVAAYALVPAIVPVLALYFLLNVLYSFFLKYVAVLDILLVSFFYLLRVIAGGIAASVFVSNWLLLCVTFLALFLVVGKRKAEYREETKRKVLEAYTPAVLDVFLAMSATLIIFSYSIYTVLVLNSPLAVYSVFFVLAG